MTDPLRNSNPGSADVWYTPDCGHVHLSTDGTIYAVCPEGVTLTREPGLRIEHDARMQDALDALQTATLWVNGSWPAPSEQAAESWRHKARSGIVALRAALASEDRTGRVAHHTDGRGNCDPGVWMECRRCNPPALASEDRP